MNRRSLLCAGAVGLSVFVLAGAVSGQQAPQAQTVTQFRVPEYDDDGNLKSQLFGEFAKILPDGVIEIMGLKIDFFQDGEVGMTVTAPQCKYNQKQAQAESDSDVRIERENMVVTGVGFAWSGKDEKFRIMDKAKVVLKNARKQMESGAQE